jgi:hypothetical protein
MKVCGVLKAALAVCGLFFKRTGSDQLGSQIIAKMRFKI